MNPVTKWECGECATLHDTEDDAIDCCPPTAYEVLICPQCETRHIYVQDAEQCCPEPPAEEPPVTAADLEAAGQGRLL